MLKYTSMSLSEVYSPISELHNCNNRNRDGFHVPLSRAAVGHRAFSFGGQKLCNSLPDEFQSVTNLILVFFKGVVLDI